MKTNFRLAWMHFRLALGFFCVACAIAVLPKHSTERQTLVMALEPFEWESK